MSAESVVINLRSAASADDREFALGRALASAGAALVEGRVVEFIWPGPRETTNAGAALGLPLAQATAALTAAAAPGGTAVIHSRAGSADDFLALAPGPRLSFVIHLNSEEAALRWERGDASPGRRLTTAARLAAAGWKTWVCVGPVRLFDGWKDDYADIAERIAAAGFPRLLVSFSGEDVMESDSFPSAAEAELSVRPVVSDDGRRLTTLPARQRREAQSLLNSRFAPSAQAAA